MPKFYIPARDSRHRRACFALYKALLRQAGQVPLADDVTALAAKHLGPARPPLQAFVRSSFRQNRGDTSPRLVLGALNKGYWFLEMLAAARTPTAPEHANVSAFVREKLAAGWQPFDPHARKHRKPRGRRATATTQPSAPHAETVPLLTRRVVQEERVGSGGERVSLYEYVATERPRPLEQLSRQKTGRRSVPRLAADASGIPFLRLGRPQSAMLSRVIRQKGKKRRDRGTLANTLRTESAPFAAEEDRWEAILAQTVGLERDVDEPPYTDSIKSAVDYLNGKLNLEAADMLARSKALLALVEAERALAEKEAEEAEPHKS